MAIQTLTNAKLLVGGYDFSGDVNAIALKYGAEAKETTNFSSGGSRTRIAGLQSFSFNHEGFWTGGASEVDDAIFNNLFAVANSVMTIDAQSAGTEGDIAYTGQVDLASYSPGAKIGDVLSFSVAGESDGAPLVRGTLVHNAARTAGANGTIYNLGAVSAAQKMYCALHVLSLTPSGSPSFGCKLQSAALVGFGSPTDRITFNASTAIGAQWGTPVSGSITDAYWRIVYTLTNISSITFAVVAGIR